MASTDLRGWAVSGRRAAAAEIAEEARAIFQAFPLSSGSSWGFDLQSTGTPRKMKTCDTTGQCLAAGWCPRRPMTAAERKAVGARIKKYWRRGARPQEEGVVSVRDV